MSARATLVAVIIAFLVGGVATLAVRPPTHQSADSGDPESTIADQGLSEITWQLPVSFQTSLEVLGDNIVFVRGAVADLTDGKFQLHIYEPNEIVPPLEISGAVRTGKVPIGYTWLGYDQGKIPASPLFGAVPFGMEPWEFSAWWFNGGGRELAEELYREENLKVLLCGMLGPETAGWFRKPIESLDDLVGLKIRFAGLGGKVIERVGASVTMLAGSEIFQALEKGAIDATEYSLPNIDAALGFDRVAKLNYFPGWHQVFTSVHMLVNHDSWNGLPHQYKSALEVACTAGVTRNFAHAEAIQGAVLDSFEEKGITANRLPDDILRELQRVAVEVMDEEAAKNEWFARVYESQKNFRADYEKWKRLAYLPRDF